MKILTAEDMIGDLVCSACRRPALVYGDAPGAAAVVCGACGRRFPYQDRIIDFLLRERLDQTNLNELAGNEYNTSDPQVVEAMTNKDTWSPVYVHSLMYALDVVHEFIRDHSEGATLISLGSGTAFELKVICSRNTFQRVFSSDISRSATALAPATLAKLDGELGLFISEFGNVPVSKRDDIIGFVFQALHHTADIHTATDLLLKQSFSRLVIVEPTTNWFVDLLARFGLAKRVEYSGVRPSWMSLRRMRAMAARRGYRTRIRTWWEFPPGLSGFFDPFPMLGRFVSRVVDLVGYVTNWFSFGSMSCILFISQRPEKTG